METKLTKEDFIAQFGFRNLVLIGITKDGKEIELEAILIRATPVMKEKKQSPLDIGGMYG